MVNKSSLTGCKLMLWGELAQGCADPHEAPGSRKSYGTIIAPRFYRTVL
jgi:hypothetical protein